MKSGKNPAANSASGHCSVERDMHLIGFFSKLKVTNVQQKNVLSQQNQLHFISYLSKGRNLLKGEI